jgi:hypothetical protein
VLTHSSYIELVSSPSEALEVAERSSAEVAQCLRTDHDAPGPAAGVDKVRDEEANGALIHSIDGVHPELGPRVLETPDAPLVQLREGEECRRIDVLIEGAENDDLGATETCMRQLGCASRIGVGTDRQGREDEVVEQDEGVFEEILSDQRIHQRQRTTRGALSSGLSGRLTVASHSLKMQYQKSVPVQTRFL